MNVSPVITIVIPTYNHADFLREALTSVLLQTYSDWEVIVLNNYSEDDTVEVVRSFGDPRIRLENFRNNGVIGASRNRGILLAKGRYIAFLDSDDTWYPDKLKNCLLYLEAGADLVGHALQYRGGREGVLYCGPERHATFDAMLDKGSCIVPSSTIVRKEVLESVGGFSEDPALVTSEDYHLWLRLAKAEIGMKFSREVLGEYRVHAGNQSSAVNKHLSSVLSVIGEFLPATLPRGTLGWLRLRRRVALAYYSAGRGMQKNEQYQEALKMYVFSVVRRTNYIKTYIALGMTLLELAKAKLFASKYR